MKECDAVIVFTSRGLLQNVLKSVKDCSAIKNVVYYSELHTKDEDPYFVEDELEQKFADENKSLYSLETLNKFGNDGGNAKICLIFYLAFV